MKRKRGEKAGCAWIAGVMGQAGQSIQPEEFIVILEEELNDRGMDGAAIVALVRDDEDVLSLLEGDNAYLYSEAWDAARYRAGEEFLVAEPQVEGPRAAGWKSCAQCSSLGDGGWCSYLGESRSPRSVACDGFTT